MLFLYRVFGFSSDNTMVPISAVALYELLLKMAAIWCLTNAR